MKIENVSNNVTTAVKDNITHVRNDVKEAIPSEEIKGGITNIDSYKVLGQQQATDNKQDAKNGEVAMDGQAIEKKIRDVVSQANQKIREGTSLAFTYHEEIKRVSVQIIDKDTKEVVREIPPEKTLDMLQKMWELAGILIDEKR